MLKERNIFLQIKDYETAANRSVESVYKKHKHSLDKKNQRV